MEFLKDNIYVKSCLTSLLLILKWCVKERMYIQLLTIQFQEKNANIWQIAWDGTGDEVWTVPTYFSGNIFAAIAVVFAYPP